jgi:membrane associated rhomboid family serine protease
MDKEARRIILSFVPGLVLVAAFWLVKLLEVRTGSYLTDFGVMPRSISGLKGIITSPFIHGDYRHLISNSVPLLVLAAGLFYFYRSLAYRVFIGVYLLGGFWLWLGGRESYHIGASGLLYGLTTFLFFSGMFRRDSRLMAFSLLIVFLYGGMVWGIFPLFTGISWEAHLFGALAGILLAFVFRKDGPQKKKYDWPPEDDIDDDPNAYWKIPQQGATELPPVEKKSEVNINYIYRADPKKPDE